MSIAATSVVDEIMDIFAKQGDDLYFGENVSQLEHALQAAHQAEQEGASNALVVAALLHDIGHLVHSFGEDVAEQGVDARHEEEGERWLACHFLPEVTEPIRLHVAAKRYLCAMEPGYQARLSEASVKSLFLQGGPFTPEEVAEFEGNPHFRQALRLRHWDDEAKIVGLVVPGLAHYRARIEAALSR